MKHKNVFLSLAILAIATMACSLFSTVANGVGNKILGTGDAGTVSKMWPDVPQMDGMKQEKMDLPLAAKVAIQGFMKASSNGEGTLNFIAFTTSKSPQDVADFYTTDTMSASGWNQEDQAGCSDFGAQATQDSSQSGAMCFFGKDDGNGKGAFLVIFISKDSSTKPTAAFFMRVDDNNMPTKQP